MSAASATPSIPGVDRDALAEAINRDAAIDSRLLARRAADVALAHIADNHKCACDRAHADESKENR